MLQRLQEAEDPPHVLGVRRIAMRQHADTDAEEWAEALALRPSCGQGLLFAPFRPADRRLVDQLARLYGFEVVAVDAHGREYGAMEGGSGEA